MAKRPPKLILASRSPRRCELLSAAGYEFEVCPPSDAAERGACDGETPRRLVVRLARQKAADVARRVQRGLVLGCDTVAECNGQILGKPADAEHARKMLSLLSGREHRVLSGLCLLWAERMSRGSPCDSACNGEAIRPPVGIATNHSIREECFTITRATYNAHALTAVAVTTLRMDSLTPAQLDEYIAGGQWEGKAGAFGYQDGLDWVHVVEGSESNVVGLPMELLAEMLESESLEP